MKKFRIIGLMSGTSLDGVDLAYCHITKDDRWKFELIEATTVPYPGEWLRRLSSCVSFSGFELMHTHVEYGHYLGKIVKHFIDKHSIQADFVSSHGHTLFHQPHLHITTQIGDGASIAAECGIPVICDFRTLDVALGGQGAPLVPAGDRLLFGEYSYCLNLGGIANISFEKASERIAFDICPVNQVLNRLAGEVGQEYDDNGNMARGGAIDSNLLGQLDALGYYQLPFPKSMGREWIDSCFMPLVEASGATLADKLATVCEHIARQISSSAADAAGRKMLVTGGGAFNGYLVERIKALCNAEIHLPDKNIISFKEAIVFAFLGALRIAGENNCLKSVTGARQDSSGGCIYVI